MFLEDVAKENKSTKPGGPSNCWTLKAGEGTVRQIPWTNASIDTGMVEGVGRKKDHSDRERRGSSTSTSRFLGSKELIPRTHAGPKQLRTNGMNTSRKALREDEIQA